MTISIKIFINISNSRLCLLIFDKFYSKLLFGSIIGDIMKFDTNKRYYTVFTAYFIIFGIIVALITSIINYRIHYVDIYKQVASNADTIYKEKALSLQGETGKLSLMLKSFSTNDLLIKFIQSQSETDRKNLESLFYSAAQSNTAFMQVRYLDENGMERVRVDRISNEAYIVPLDKLQNKSDRYYFKETALLKDQKMWSSKIDLNIEHGKIEVPLKPTFRVAVPVYVNSLFRGIVIINLFMENMLSNLTSLDGFDIYIIDGNGEILISPKSDEAWSRYLPNRKNFAKLFPEETENILISDSYKSKTLFSYSMEKYFNNGENLRMVFIPKQSALEKMKNRNVYAAILIAAIVLAVSVPLSWIAALVPSKLQTKLSVSNLTLKKYNDILNKFVISTTTDEHGVITHVSDAFCKVSGYSKEELIGQTNVLVRHPENSPAIYEELWKTLKSGMLWEGDLRCVNKSGEIFWLHKIISPEFDSQGKAIGYTSIDYDCTNAKIIENMSVTDQLTKIYNRRKLDEALETEMVRYNRYKSDFSVILLDIDHFKNVNDTYGHSEGDRVLVELANILKNNTRSTDTVGRWGGEEFLIIAAGTDSKQCLFLAEKLRAAVQDHDFGLAGQITISLGCARYKYGDTIAHFIVNADNSLYKAKQGGRNRVELYDAD